MAQFRCGHERIIEVKENEDRPYLYDVGGEQKETIPMTKELRQWLQSFISIGGRALNTFSEIRELTKHYAGQIMICFENNAIYQYQSVTTVDNGSTCLKPDNVDSDMNGRWILKTYLTDTAYNIWDELKYNGDVVENVTLYVDNISGTDDVINDGTELLPFKTIQYAIDTYVYSRGYWKGTLTIRLIDDYEDVLSLVGLIGNGSLVIQSNDSNKKFVSIGEFISVKNNQIHVTFNNIESDSMLVDRSNVTLIDVTTGDGTAINSMLNIGIDSVFGLDCNYCEIKAVESYIKSNISNSLLNFENMDSLTEINAVNSIIINDSITILKSIDNCVLSKDIKLIAHTISESDSKAVVDGLILTTDLNYTQRGVCFKENDIPTIDDEVVLSSSSVLSINATSGTHTDCVLHARCFVKHNNIAYYSNDIAISIGEP